MEDRFFGPPDVQIMSRRAQALFNLVKDDPQYVWFGRFVAPADVPAMGIEAFVNLIRIQGACPGYFIPIGATDEVDAALDAWGMRRDWYEYVVTDGDSVARAREILAEHTLGGDLEVTRLGTDSPDEDLDAFAEVAGVGGVLPPPASVLRGEARRGVFLVARDKATGRPVTCAAAVESFHPDSHAGDHGFWGMLSTVPEWRGRKLALILGAQAMVTMSDEHGVSKFTTSVRPSNEGSMALCAKLDMKPGKWRSVVGMDPGQFSGDRVTK